MDCRTAREWMATAVAEALDPAEAVRVHLSQCPGCQDEFQAFKRTWDLLGAWSETEPPARLDRAILAGAETETSRSWLRLVASGRVWATAAVAATLAVVISFFVPYQDSLRLCGTLLGDMGLALPALLLSFLVGFPYAFLPLLGAVLVWMYLRGNDQKMQGLAAGQAFAAIMVPYLLFACADLEAMAIAGILIGTVTGGLLGGAASQWVIRHRPRGVTA
ncbi:MAG: zf-HC2 domain-containing protein [Acidobacteria bacterium]|nr:zf-HC2 domain-containing protein [Acidobacteriota bacterium]